MKQTFRKLAIGTMLAIGFVANANATIYTINFTNLSSELQSQDTDEDANISGGFSGIFATLTFDSNIPSFNILANNLNGAFGTGARITGIAFNSFQNAGGGTTLPVNATNVTGNTGVAASGIDRSNNQLPTNFDFKYEISGSGEIANTENLGFTLAGFNPTCLTATTSTCTLTTTPLAANLFALRINASGNGNESWYAGNVINANGGAFAATASPVPEAETYAMFLAGLGLIGFISRRRKQA